MHQLLYWSHPPIYSWTYITSRRKIVVWFHWLEGERQGGREFEHAMTSDGIRHQYVTSLAVWVICNYTLYPLHSSTPWSITSPFMVLPAATIWEPHPLNASTLTTKYPNICKHTFDFALHIDWSSTMTPGLTLFGAGISETTVYSASVPGPWGWKKANHTSNECSTMYPSPLRTSI